MYITPDKIVKTSLGYCIKYYVNQYEISLACETYPNKTERDTIRRSEIRVYDNNSNTDITNIVAMELYNDEYTTILGDITTLCNVTTIVCKIANQ